MKITSFLDVKSCHWQTPTDVNLKVFSFSPERSTSGVLCVTDLLHFMPVRQK